MDIFPTQNGVHQSVDKEGHKIMVGVCMQEKVKNDRMDAFTMLVTIKLDLARNLSALKCPIIMWQEMHQL